jgi:hypothetical protein
MGVVGVDGEPLRRYYALISPISLQNGLPILLFSVFNDI